MKTSSELQKTNRRKAYKQRHCRLPEQVANRKKTYATLWGRFIHWRCQAKVRAKPWSLEYLDLQKIPMLCHYTGMKLTFKTHQPNTVSLDRINSKLGYTRSNSVFCCHIVNIAKNALTTVDFVNMCRQVTKHTLKGR
jgi:hypothetical protein